ncbi:MAG: hypothetical protein HOP23_04010 [Methylococcaceae bacterium]|nr:hypothetical protein [Methylococcaceae bacterium]
MKDANTFSVDKLLETSVPALFVKAGINDDPFNQGFYKVIWTKMLERERDELSAVAYSDLKQSRIQQINKKLSEFKHEPIEEPLPKLVGEPDRKERNLTKWLRETWIKEGKLGGTGFFNVLRRYVNVSGSPIVEHYTSGKNGAGLRWNTGNATNYMTKKTIQSKVSIFKKSP